MARGQLYTKDLVSRFQACSRLDECLDTLAATRLVTQFGIVGFKEGHQVPAVSRIPRPHYWTRRFGWPKDFLRGWLRFNIAGTSLMPEMTRTQSNKVLRWHVPDPDDPRDTVNLTPDQILGARFLRENNILSGITVSVLCPQRKCAQVSWLKPVHKTAISAAIHDRDMLNLAQAFFDSLHRVRPLKEEGGLSDRELQCLSWAAYGCSDKEIAQEIGCAHDTVRFHMKNLVRKLGATNRTHAVAVAMQRGLIRLGGLTTHDEL